MLLNLINQRSYQESILSGQLQQVKYMIHGNCKCGCTGGRVFGWLPKLPPATGDAREGAALLIRKHWQFLPTTWHVQPPWSPAIDHLRRQNIVSCSVGCCPYAHSAFFHPLSKPWNFMIFEKVGSHEVSQFSKFQILFKSLMTRNHCSWRKKHVFFRGHNWAKPGQVKAYQDRCLDYMDLCDPKLVHQEPPLFWGFWGQCFNDYRYGAQEGWASWASCGSGKHQFYSPKSSSLLHDEWVRGTKAWNMNCF